MAGFNAHYVAAALAHSKDQLLLDLISKVWKDKQNPGKRHIDSMFSCDIIPSTSFVNYFPILQNLGFVLVEMFLTQDVQNISCLLAFIGRHTRVRDDESGVFFTDDRMKKLIGGEGLGRFYQVKTKMLKDKSLLQYVVDNGARMMKQREELLELLEQKVERYGIAHLRDKATHKRIIENLKLGLPSSIGLNECLKMTEAKFPWTRPKKFGMILLSVAVGIFSIILYLADVFTDVDFVLEMLQHSRKNFTEIQHNCRTDFFLQLGKCNQICSIQRETEDLTGCYQSCETNANLARKCRQVRSRYEDLNVYKQNALFGLVHCLLPYLWIILASMYHIKRPKRLPIPIITRIYKIHLQRKNYEARSQQNFKDRVEQIEAEITEHEESVNLASIIEAATEATPQFFFQTLHLLPLLIINLTDFEGFEDLVSYNVLSVVFSFSSVAISTYFIRSK